MEQQKLPSSPNDAISSVKFDLETGVFLLASSWDCEVRLYDVLSNSLRHKYQHQAPVLDVCLKDNSHSYSGGLDNVLKKYDFNKATATIMGTHNKAIRCVEYCQEVNGIITGSWDTTMKLWDPRSSTCCGTYNCDEKVFAMSVCAEKIVVGTSCRKILVWDIRNMAYVNQRRVSSLKYQTRTIKCFPNKQGFVIGSIEGRVSVEYFNANPEIQKKKYAFKCHRIKDNDIERIYSVNALSFHPQYNTFATGGSDGFVNIWDPFNKKKMCQFTQYDTSISSLCFNDNGTLLAIACSSIEDIPPKTFSENSIYIRNITKLHCKPK